MKRFAIITAILGLTLFTLLVAHSGFADVMNAVGSAGWATALVVLARAVAVTFAGLAWRLLFPARQRLSAGISVLLRFIREAVNQLLPVGQVGGDVVGARLATFWGGEGALAGAVTIADVAIQAATQFVFAMAGIAVLVALQGDGEIVRYAIVGVGVGAAGIAAFFGLQGRYGSRIMSAIVQRLGGEEGRGLGLVERLWARLGTVYSSRSRLARSVALHMCVWLFGTVEVYVALHAMGFPVSWAEALVIESLGQAVRGAAFAVPGGLGVQEGGYVALCALFGIPPGPALALSLLKRVADLVLGLPFLAVWQVIEGRRALGLGAMSQAEPHPGAGRVSLASTLLLAASGAGLAYLALAAACLARLAGQRVPALDRHPSVTVLKPLHGAEPGLRANLETFLRQDYRGEIQFVFGVQSAADPAGDVVRSLQAAFPECRIDLVVDARQHGTNRKVSNLVNMDALARHEVVVLADSDMRVGPDDLAKVVALLGGEGVGAVTCPYHGLPADNVWARLVALGIDTHFLPGVAVGIGLGLGRPCMGSTIALRRETLDRIGGFRALADELADDHVLGERVRAQGLSVVVAPFTVAHACPGGSLDVLLGQELRWLRTIRQIEPAGHVGSLAAHPLPFALLAFVCEPGGWAAAAIAAATLARIGLCLAAERRFGLNRHVYWLVPVRDLLSFALLVTSFFGRGVIWRGYRYEVARSGALLPKTRPDPT